MLLQLGPQTVRANTIVFVLRRPVAVRRPVAARSKSTDVDSTLNILRTHGIPDEDGPILVASILSMKGKRALEPKLKFLRSTGLTGPELADVLLRNPSLLHESLDRTLVPYIESLKSVLPSKHDLIRALSIRGVIPASNIQVLKDRGVPDQLIVKIIVKYGDALRRNPSVFLDALERLQELGIHPTNGNFARGLGTANLLTRSAFLGKVRLFRELGFSSDKDVYLMFRRFPPCLVYSEELIRRRVVFYKEATSLSSKEVATMLRAHPRFLGLTHETFLRKVAFYKELGWTSKPLHFMFVHMPHLFCFTEELIRRKVAFYTDKVGYSLEILFSNPALLGYSLEKRIIPRCAVLNLLFSRGFLTKHPIMMKFKFGIPEEKFRRRFVDEYREVVPLVIDAYEGKIEFRGWDCLVDGDEGGDEDEGESSNKEEEEEEEEEEATTESYGLTG